MALNLTFREERGATGTGGRNICLPAVGHGLVPVYSLYNLAFS